MVIFGVKISDNDKLKELINNFNKELETNLKGIDGNVTYLNKNVIIFNLINYMSFFDLPKHLTFLSIKYKWKKKGYKEKFVLIKNKELIRILWEKDK